MRTLSSAQTLLLKAVLPPVWILGFGAAVLGIWSGRVRLEGPTESLSLMRWLFLFMWAFGAGFIYWAGARLKRVQLDGATLLVSNYRDTIRIPLRDIAEITENRWLSLHPVTLHLRRPSEFGQEIVFMPRVRPFGLWFSHPVVGELRDLIARESGSLPSGTSRDAGG